MENENEAFENESEAEKFEKFGKFEEETEKFGKFKETKALSWSKVYRGVCNLQGLPEGHTIRLNCFGGICSLERTTPTGIEPETFYGDRKMCKARANAWLAEIEANQ